MKPPARAIVGNLVWGTDGGVWATWRVDPLPLSYQPRQDQLAAHARLRGVLVGLPEESMLLSVCERLDPWDVLADMVQDIDLDAHPAWAQVADASAGWLAGMPGGLFRRRFYVCARVGTDVPASVGDRLRGFAGRWGTGPTTVPAQRIDDAARAARSVAARLSAHVELSGVSAGELRWLFARGLRREIGDPAFDASWEPRSQRRGGVVAQLTDAVVKEGGTRADEGRPRHRRYLRVDAGGRVGFQTVLAVADMPHRFAFPGTGECLTAADSFDFPVDWCIRLRSVPNELAQPKLRRQHRELIGQFDEYDGEIAGAPPELSDAVAGIESMRARLASSPSEPELWATVLFSVAAADLTELERRATAVAGRLEPYEFGAGRPTGGQMALTRAFLPGTTAPGVCDDYRQYLLAGDLAGTAPLTATTVGDPTGLLAGVSVDAGVPVPVLFDPTFPPRVGASASVGVCGALGSGKSFFLKRLCWDTIARGGQVVTIDRTAMGEYVRFARSVPGRTQIVELGPDASVCLDPLVVFDGDTRTTVALGFLSLLAGCATQSEEGATLAEAVHHVADGRGRLSDVVDTLVDGGHCGDEIARSLGRRLDHFRRLGIGRLAFTSTDRVEVVDRDADLVVFWAPHLALPDRDTLTSEHLARQMLPEQIIGNALLYLVAALGREVIFSDPGRFGAALYDEAWALLGSPHGQRLLLEGVRDGRKHNGAVWLASQHPADLGHGELVDLLGPRFVFRQAPGAVAPSLRVLGADHTSDAADVIAGLGTGECLYRDARGRIGRLQVTPPVLDHVAATLDTTPTTTQPHPAPDPTTVTAAGIADQPDVSAPRAEQYGPVGERIDVEAVNAARARARRRRATPVSRALASTTS